MGIITVFEFTSDTETVTRTKLNNTVANLVTEFNGAIDDDNIAAAAAIAATKLDLSTILQNIAFTGTLDFSGATLTAATTWADVTLTTADINGGTIDGVTIGGASAGAGTFTDLTSTGDTVIGNASGDAFTINPNAWTLSNAVTVTGTWADLGTVTTADINGGTLDGVQIGGTTATGELIVNNSSNDADGLGSQGAAGQVLTSAGADSNPTWADNSGNTEAAFQVYRTTSNQSLSIGNAAKIAWEAEYYDTGSDFDVTTNDRFDVPTTGKYFFNLRVTFEPSNADEFLLYLKIDGSTEWYLYHLHMYDARYQDGVEHTISGSIVLSLSSGSYVESWAKVSGGSANIKGNGNYTTFEGFLLT